jgi:hypothetical protein
MLCFIPAGPITKLFAWGRDESVSEFRVQDQELCSIMLTCIVRFMAITPIVSEREGLQ